jgi:hypothetical protein
MAGGAEVSVFEVLRVAAKEVEEWLLERAQQVLCELPDDADVVWVRTIG